MEANITFGPEDFKLITPHYDDPMVVMLQLANYEVKRILIDQGSSADVLYYDAFQGLGLKVEQLKHFEGTLIGFSNEEVEVLGYIELEVVFGEYENDSNQISGYQMHFNLQRHYWEDNHQPMKGNASFGVLNHEIPCGTN